jgi:hypothetical protein
MEKWLELSVVSSDLEAELIREFLRSEGIEIRVRSEKVSPYPVNIGMIGGIRLLVKEADIDRALELLEVIEDGYGDGLTA